MNQMQIVNRTPTLSPETSLPFDYFCLFIPIYFWTKIAFYTNSKAEMTKEAQDGHARVWVDSCGAEIKACFASIMWWCLCKAQSFEHFYNNTVDPSKSQIHTKILTIDITECSRSKSFMIHLNL